MNFLATALGFRVCVLLAALDDTGPLPLLLALLGGDIGQDDGNDGDDDDSPHYFSPGDAVLILFTCIAVNYLIVPVVACFCGGALCLRCFQLAANAVEVLRPINELVLHLEY